MSQEKKNPITDHPDKLDYEKAMKQLDDVVAYLREGRIDSYPRDMFESYPAHIQELENASMNEAKSREILGDWIDEDGLYDIPGYIRWNTGQDVTLLDGLFTPDQLEAIAWWMRNFKEGD